MPATHNLIPFEWKLLVPPRYAVVSVPGVGNSNLGRWDDEFLEVESASSKRVDEDVSHLRLLEPHDVFHQNKLQFGQRSILDDAAHDVKRIWPSIFCIFEVPVPREGLTGWRHENAVDVLKVLYLELLNVVVETFGFGEIVFVGCVCIFVDVDGRQDGRGEFGG
jgi:hypothetical protein